MDDCLSLNKDRWLDREFATPLAASRQVPGDRDGPQGEAVGPVSQSAFQ